jgi:hypothetical protein
VRARTIHRAVLRESPRLWFIAVVGFGFTAFVSLLQPSAFMRGVVAGAGVAATLACVSFTVVLLGGTAPLMTGELAEQWTASALRPLRDHGWKLVNHVPFNDGDADHVLIGPGGVVVIETKWRREPWRAVGRNFDRDAAIRQAQEKGRSVGLLLQPLQVTPRPVVVRWTGRGSTAPDASTSQVFGDTTVVPGHLLRDWALRRGRDVLTPTQVEQGWKLLAEHAVRSEAYENERSPVPTSFDALTMRVFAAVVLGLGVFTLLVGSLSWLGSLVMHVVGVGGVGALSLLARSRVRPAFRLYALSLATSCLPRWHSW